MIENAVLYAWIGDCKRRGLDTHTVEEALMNLRNAEIEKLRKDNGELHEWVDRLNAAMAVKEREIERLTKENNVLAACDSDPLDIVAEGIAEGITLTPEWWTKLKGFLRGKSSSSK